VLSIHGILRREYLVERRYRLEMLKDAIAGAAVTSVLSDAAAEPFRRYALGKPIVLPGGVVSAEYAGERSPAETPTLLCAASLDDPRKRGALLIRAFGRVRADVPDARLVLAGGGDPGALAGGDGLPGGVETLDVDRTDALAHAYRSAWATVLPSIHEAFGLVLLESLAAGTPVVAARSGAAPEVVSANGSTSRLFDPDDEAGLARAMREALALPKGPETVTACREQAARYEWDRIVVDYESAYATAAGSPA
jgi:phosphatidylinositol alpha-mannosyltransferase